MELSDIAVEIDTVDFTCDDVAWGVNWSVKFILAQPAPRAGWIIQHILARHRSAPIRVPGAPVVPALHVLRLGDGTMVDRPADEYWEAWPVAAGERVPHTVNAKRVRSQIIRTMTDEYTARPNPKLDENKATGSIMVTGRVAFYLGDLPQSWVPEGTGGSLFQTKIQPTFWQEDGAARHDLVVNFNKGIRGTLQTVPEVQNIGVHGRGWPTW